MAEKIKIAAVVGPTASGKSALAVALAKRLGGEIISCDSMQIYKRMDIGTGKITKEEMDGVPHHMLDIAEPYDEYSCADYVRDARLCIEDIVQRGKLPIFCGGTGLYLDSLIRGSDFEKTEVDPEYRKELERVAREEGVLVLHEMLRKADPASADEIHPNNVKRVIRALEIFKTSGKTKSVLDRESREADTPYELLAVCPHFSDREVLYSRINKRIDKMISDGLIDEVKALRDEGVFDVSKTASQAIGYKEFFDYLDGKEELKTAVETLKMSTRRYAKRQLTWFSGKEYVTPISVCNENGDIIFEEIVNNAAKLFIESVFYGIIPL